MKVENKKKQFKENLLLALLGTILLLGFASIIMYLSIKFEQFGALISISFGVAPASRFYWERMIIVFPVVFLILFGITTLENEKQKSE